VDVLCPDYLACHSYYHSRRCHSALEEWGCVSGKSVGEEASPQDQAGLAQGTSEALVPAETNGMSRNYIHPSALVVVLQSGVDRFQICNRARGNTLYDEAW
jgi:hypothetical protein